MILKLAKERGLKVSQVIDVAIKSMGIESLQRLQAVWRQAEAYLDGESA